MNKVKKVLSKIKLTDYEKQWLLSWLVFALATALLPLFAYLHKMVLAVLALIWIIWMVLNVVGLIYCIFHVVAEWVSNLRDESWIVKTVNWFSTNDRH